jgi:hypothetical protein
MSSSEDSDDDSSKENKEDEDTISSDDGVEVGHTSAYSASMCRTFLDKTNYLRSQALGR